MRAWLLSPHLPPVLVTLPPGYMNQSFAIRVTKCRFKEAEAAPKDVNMPLRNARLVVSCSMMGRWGSRCAMC